MSALATPHHTSIPSRLRAMLAERLGLNEQDIADGLHLVDELYVDSLDLVEIEIGVMETFGVELSEEDILTMQTVADLRTIVSNKLALL